jgi:hypothetical protein
MEFEIRQSGIFIMNMFLIIMAVFMAVFSFFYQGFRFSIYHYSFILWLVLGLARLFLYWKYIPLILSKKTALIVNESFIYDLADGIKYNWKDIRSVEEENAYLYIKLNNSDEYLANIQNPLKRFFKSIISEPFKINIDMIKINANVLLEILDDYSMQAEEMEHSGSPSIITNP